MTDTSRTSTNTRGRILLHGHGLTGPTPPDALPPPILVRPCPGPRPCGVRSGNGRPGSEITASRTLANLIGTRIVAVQAGTVVAVNGELGELDS